MNLRAQNYLLISTDSITIPLVPRNKLNNNLSPYIKEYLTSFLKATILLSHQDIEKTISELAKLKKRDGRLFLIGVGGSAANCSHAVNDFRKIAGIETYTPIDNVSELTARTNDDGWDSVFVNWLKGSNLKKKDAVMVFSVGGGNVEKNISVNIVRALQYAKQKKSLILGIVSRDGGYTKQVADVCVLVPVVDEDKITPFAESFQGALWHLFCFHPLLRDVEPY